MRLTPPWSVRLQNIAVGGAGDTGSARRCRGAGSRSDHGIFCCRPLLIVLASIVIADRRRQLPRRCTALRRRRRWAVLRRCRPRHSAKAFGRGYFRLRSKAARRSFITAVPACGISARSNTSCSARATSAIYRSFSCCHSWPTRFSARFLPSALVAHANFAFCRDPARHACSARRSCNTSNGQAKDLPTRRPTFSFSALFFPLSARLPPAHWKNSAGVLRRAPAGARDLHETDHCARRRGLAWRRRPCRALFPAMGEACRPVRRLLAGVVHGAAQLGLRPCACAVQHQCRGIRPAGDAAVGLCGGGA